MPDTKVVFYGAGWCIHCENAKRWLNENNIEYEFKNVDESVNKNYLMNLDVQSIPFFQVKREGKEDANLQGVRPEQLIQAIQ